MHILCAHDLFSQERPNVKITGTAVPLVGIDVAAMFVDALEAALKSSARLR